MASAAPSPREECVVDSCGEPADYAGAYRLGDRKIILSFCELHFDEMHDAPLDFDITPTQTELDAAIQWLRVTHQGTLSGARIEMVLGALDRAPSPRADPVGLLDIAHRLGARPQTVRTWRLRGRLPEPEWMVSGLPVWDWPTITAWVVATGRRLPDRWR